MAGGIVTRLNWNTATVSARVRGGSDAATLAAARAILTEANKTVPYETGRLKSTGKAENSRTNSGSAATVSYSTPYAVRLHENPQYRFRGKGRGKWLQLAVQESAGRVAGLMAIALRRSLGTGT